ncbi:MAG: deoxyribose-phosphate aldolase [Nakamurella sp.]
MTASGITAISAEQFTALREARAWHPERIATAYAARCRRSLLTDGHLLLVAADHPARGALSVHGDPMAMANRYDLLQRLVLALSRPGVDGVLATPDILDDLALLGALDGKIVAGSMNRGGLAGASFEMDDRFTAHDVASIIRDGLDFAKVLLRVNRGDDATALTLDATAHAVSEAAAAHLPIMVEPFMSSWSNHRIMHDLSADGVITSVAIAAGLGTTSAYTWLKLPVVPDMERVMAATTLPTLLLGGDPSMDPDDTYAKWAAALTLPGVRGLVVGRQLIYPPDGNVALAVDTAASLVHGAPSASQPRIAPDTKEQA